MLVPITCTEIFATTIIYSTSSSASKVKKISNDRIAGMYTLLHNEFDDSSCPVALQLDNIIIPASVTTYWRRIPGRDWRIAPADYSAFEGPIAHNGCRVGPDRAHVVVLSRRQEREKRLIQEGRKERDGRTDWRE